MIQQVVLPDPKNPVNTVTGILRSSSNSLTYLVLYSGPIDEYLIRTNHESPMTIFIKISELNPNKTTQSVTFGWLDSSALYAISTE